MKIKPFSEFPWNSYIIHLTYNINNIYIVNIVNKYIQLNKYFVYSL